VSELFDAFAAIDAHSGGDAGAGDDRRYFGFVYGKVTNVQDDQGLGRIRARLAAQQDGEESHWLVPFWPGAIESLPNVGDIVIVGFVDGDPMRGFYGWHATTNTKERPTEHMVLGDTLVAMFNYLVTQFNQLRSDFSGHVHTAGTLLDSVSGACTGSTASAATTAMPANRGKAADGSIVSDRSTREIVLSGTAKVRK